MSRPAPFDLHGLQIHAGALDPAGQAALLAALGPVMEEAPPVSPMTPWGKPMRVRMTSAGRFGWVSGRGGYRYEPRRADGRPWPPIPPAALAIWSRYAGTDRAPDCALINHYPEGARMGLHQDRDEADMTQPVVSVSLGDDGLLRAGGLQRKAPTASHWLKSGDVVVMSGAARLTYHGIDRIRFGSSGLLPEGGRLNLTLRVAG